MLYYGDIRVDSKYKRKGYGKILLEKAKQYAVTQNCTQMIIETQNNNPNAIAFYERNGAILTEVNKNHYQDLPKEEQLIFFIHLNSIM